MKTMKHAKDITAGELEVGTKFKYAAHDFVDGELCAVEKTGTVTAIRMTKAGRIGFSINGKAGEWSNAPMSPTTCLQNI